MQSNVSVVRPTPAVERTDAALSCGAALTLSGVRSSFAVACESARKALTVMTEELMRLNRWD